MPYQPRHARHARTRRELSAVVAARVRYATLIAVCADCSGDPKALRKALKRAVKARGRRDVRVVATGCLDVCPKRATTVAVAGDGGARVVVVAAGIDAEALADELLAGQNSRG